MEALEGHIKPYRNDKAHHKSLGPSSKAAADTAEPADSSKSKFKGKKAAGEKTTRASTNIDEASVIVVSPVVLYL